MLKPEQVRNYIAGNDAKIAHARSVFLRVKNHHGFWVFKFWDPKERKRREHCLGSAADMTPAAALRERDSVAVKVREGGIVLAGRRPTARPATGDLFKDVAEAWLSNHADEWTESGRAQRRSIVRRFATPLMDKRLPEITADDVADTLRPIWTGPGANRGSRLRSLIEGICRSRDIEPNPASWDRLRERLLKKAPTVKHHAAMPFAEVPAFFKTLGDSAEDRAGRLVFLTAVRRSEALEATWREFDWVARTWTIPRERMKDKRKEGPHIVPLTDAMIAALGTPGDKDALVFPSPKIGGVLSSEALNKEWFIRHGAPVLGKTPKGAPITYTLHGIRSSFKGWAISQDDGRLYPYHVVESALDHAIDWNNVAKAYSGQVDLLKARKPLLATWSAYVTGK